MINFDSILLANKRHKVSKEACINDIFQPDQNDKKKNRNTVTQAIITLDLFFSDVSNLLSFILSE